MIKQNDDNIFYIKLIISCNMKNNLSEKLEDSPDNESIQSVQLESRLKKKINVQGKIVTMYPNDKQNILQKFEEGQIKRLVSHLSAMEQYYKLISLQIKHQQDSITTLSQSITQRFPQLKNRKTEMILKSQTNIKFLQEILDPYKQMVFTHLSDHGFKQKNQQTSHSHYHRIHNMIAKLFQQAAVEWTKNIQHTQIANIIEFSRIYWDQIKQSMSHNSQNSQKVNILVVGCGMGRILSEIKDNFKETSINALLQGHQTEVHKYLCAQYFLNLCQEKKSIYPYIHNFANFVKESSPYRQIVVPYQVKNHSYFYPITWGKFEQLYKSHENQWNCIITMFNNYHIQNLFLYIKLIYKMLSEGGIWIDACTANFSKNIMQLSYKQYQNILDKSQFKLLQKKKLNEFWFQDKECIMNEKRTTYYRIMKK